MRKKRIITAIIGISMIIITMKIGIIIIKMGFVKIVDVIFESSEYYKVIDLENSDCELNQDEKDKLISLLQLDTYIDKEKNIIEFTKIFYGKTFQEPMASYIIFKTSISDNLSYSYTKDNYSSIQVLKEDNEYIEYRYMHICNLSKCNTLSIIKEILKNHYKLIIEEKNLKDVVSEEHIRLYLQ